MREQRVDTLVVGAGITGLAYALARKARGEAVRVLAGRGDARDEEGPAFVRGDAALPDGVTRIPTGVPGRPTLLWSRGGLVAWPRVSRQVPTRVVPARVGSASSRQPLDVFLRRALGTRLAQTWAAPQVRAAWGRSAARLGAADAWPTLVAGIARRGAAGGARHATRLHALADEQAHLLQGGVPALRRALAKELASSLEPSGEVQALEPEEGVKLVDGRRMPARQIVLAVDAPEQARLLRGSDEVAADDLAAIPTVPWVDLLVEVDPRAWARLPRTPGLLVAPDAPARLHVLLLLSHLDPGGGPRRLEVSMGGAPEVDALSDAQLVDIVTADLSRLVRRPVQASLARIRRSRRALPTPGLGARLAQAGARLEARGIVLPGPVASGGRLEERLAAGAGPRGPLPAGLEVC